MKRRDARRAAGPTWPRPLRDLVVAVAVVILASLPGASRAAAYEVRQPRVAVGAGGLTSVAYTIPCGDLTPGGGTMISANYVLHSGCGATHKAVVAVEQPPATGGLVVGGPRPNPFVRVTTIHYQLPTTSVARVEIFDLSGRLVHAAAGIQGAGWQETHWDGRDREGRIVRAGLYHYRLTAGATVANGRLVKLH